MDKAVRILGERMRERRRELRLTQETAAEMADVDPSYWSQLESSKYKNPGLVTVQRVAQALNTTMSYLIGEIDDPSPPPSIAAAHIEPGSSLEYGDPLPAETQLIVEKAIHNAIQEIWERAQQKKHKEPSDGGAG